MSISIPAILDTQLANLKASVLPHTDATTHTAAATDLFVRGNRVGDLLRCLTALIDTTGLLAVAIGSSTTAVKTAGAFTRVNSLVGAKVTFLGDVTPALAGVTAFVVSNTTNTLNLNKVLPSAPGDNDTFSVEYAAVDAEIDSMSGGKGLGDSASNPYGFGPTMISALVRLIGQLGGAVPAWLSAATVPFTVGSPFAGGSAGGHGGGALIASALQLVRDTIALYTKPS